MQDAFYCVLCDKQFKSARALANHERSKKHAEAFEALRAVLEEEQALQAQDKGTDEGATSAEETDGAEAPAAADLSGVHTRTAAVLGWSGVECSQCLWDFLPMCQAVQAIRLFSAPLGRSLVFQAPPNELPGGVFICQTARDMIAIPKIPRLNQNSSVPADLEKEEASSPPEQAPALSRSKKKQRKKAKQLAKLSGASANREPSDSEPSTVSNEGGERPTTNGEAIEADSSSKETAGEELSEEELLQRMMAASSLNTWADVQELEENSHSAEAEASPVARASVRHSAGQQQITDNKFGEAPIQTQAKKKPGRGKVKKKAAAKGLEGTPQASATACMVCGTECSTRNKLFKHIKDTGHAALR